MSRAQRRRRERKPILHQPGMSPGTLTAEPGARRPAMRLLAYGPDRIEEKALGSPDDARPYLGAFPVVWIDVDGVGDASIIARFGEILGLHRLALEDVLHTHQRPKIEPYAGHLFIVVRMADIERRHGTEQLSLFLGQNFVLTFQERPGDCFDPLRARLREGASKIREAGADYLAYRILDAALDDYFPVLERFDDLLEELEDSVTDRPGRAEVTQLQEVRRGLLDLRRAVWPQRELFASLVRDPSPLVGEETRLYLRDCQDHAVQIIDLVENYREICSWLMDIYLSSVSNRLNEIMKVLTIIATIFMPLSFLASLWGMNFHTERSPWNMPELTWRYGYPLALGLMTASVLAMLWFFRRRGWLGSHRPLPPPREEGGAGG